MLTVLEYFSGQEKDASNLSNCLATAFFVIVELLDISLQVNACCSCRAEVRLMVLKRSRTLSKFFCLKFIHDFSNIFLFLQARRTATLIHQISPLNIDVRLKQSVSSGTDRGQKAPKIQRFASRGFARGFAINIM